MRKGWKAWLLLSPMLVIMLVFVVYPIIRTLFYSFYRLKLTEPDNVAWIGLANYRAVLTSSDFYQALVNSGLVLVFTVLLGLIMSLAIALMLNRRHLLTPVLTAIAIVPWALPPIVNGIIWKFIFYPGYGFLNKLLLNLQLIEAPIAWTANRWMLMFIAALVVAWRVVPFCAILLLANLQTIPGELYEASRIDGASAWQDFRLITLPMLLPSLVIVLIQMTMAAINVFDEIVALSGYRFESQTLLVYNYMNTFSFLNFGFGSAITYVVTILSGLLGFAYIRRMARDV
ncbi:MULTISPECIES: carbohydrate ABC transporter permease [Aerococcus]|uniref:Sugar ABC transporter permease n=1 Tax=Aerococcus sanguinicola TaxID=119206 RepID=A0A5N1GLN7_9LACT|nr:MULTISPECIES: sugar ABC transporter permease [Aerococcus]KAA9301304.1 sugar ABC transporter permease [Aerococcus sanguinicola]MDK6370059.1 sugar ABC transporter permease [Aerococcus sp. UMB9870]MDK6687458.1 sugar ABC transporter permease [Aerococcus sp. UMB8623]MDK6940625.1 sugar ABC transporter permease [Aerococcus sp. UMB8487]OFK20526.1 sugar ABC transporter permease [Aerococcus sp. HMSC072A12]